VALTPKQERFVAEYLIDLNATAAYKRAGYVAEGHGAEVNASRLLSNAEVAASIAAKQQKLADKYELTADLVVRSIVQELTFDPAKLYGADGNLLKITELPEDVRMALTSVEFEQIGNPDAPVFVRKVKWAQRQGAREQAMKHLGMFEKDNEQRNPVGELSEAALQRFIERKAKEAGLTLH
jgi:phage terminase small subunit